MIKIKKIRSRKAFTLLELITVLVILGILAVVAIRGFGTVKRKALCSRAKSDMREIVLQIELYMQLNQESIDQYSDWEDKLIPSQAFTQIPQVAGGEPNERYGIWSDMMTGDIIVWSPYGPAERPDKPGTPWPYDIDTDKYGKFPCHVLDQQFSNEH